MEESYSEHELSDQLIINRFKPYLDPDESDFYYVLGQKQYSTGGQLFILALLGFILGPIFMSKTYFIGLTSHRLLLMNISGGFKEKSFESIEISDIGGVKIEDKYRYRYVTILLRTEKEYKFKIEKSLYTVKKQQENLQKMCQILNVQ
ncbi:MAG: hypothetical protein PVF58_21845 [Candidatus Methanofastidiosia archaeon]|jgi:hypothetical protein